jgi:hypothetical protein
MPFVNKSPLNYPLNSESSIRIFETNRAPTTSDFRNFIVGDEWNDTSSNDFWKLVQKDSTSGTWRKMVGTSAAAETFIPDSGTSPVVPTAANQITHAGGTGITTVGSLNTMTWNIDADIAQSYVTDAGTATPALNAINILGGTGIGTVGAGANVTINATGTTVLQVTAEDATTATPAANNINIVGTATNGINTTAAGSTLTISMATPYSDGDFAFTNTAAGTSRTLLVNNTDAAAGSSAQLTIETPNAGEDPFVYFSVAATTDYSFGIDNSDSDNLKLTDGADPSTGNTLFQMTPAGVPSFPASPIGVASGGTGATTLTDHGVLVGSGVGAITPLAAATNGQLVIGSTGADPAVAALTAGAGIAIANGAGTITISSTGSGLAWVEATGATQAMAVATSYGANRGGGVTFTLPAAAAQGSVIEIVGIAGLWALNQNAGQTVHVGAFSTTTGAGGSLTATNAGDCIVLRCITTDTDFRVQNMMGNPAIV